MSAGSFSRTAAGNRAYIWRRQAKSRLISDEMILAYVADVKRGRGTGRGNSGMSPSPFNWTGTQAKMIRLCGTFFVLFRTRLIFLWP